MGDGKKLKKILDEKNMSIRKVAIESGIVPTTLYSIIGRDSPIRYDYAMRISKVLEIPEELFCAAAPAKDEKEAIYPEIETMMRHLSKKDQKIVERFIKALYEAHGV